MNSHREAGLNFLRAQNAFRSSELYRTRNFTTSGLPDELSQDYQMNFHWNSGSPLMDWIFDPELWTESLAQSSFMYTLCA